VLSWNAIAAIATALSVVVALIAFAVQARHLKQSIASATYQEIVRMFDDFSKLIIERPQLYNALYRDVEITDANLRQQADWAIGIRFDWFESVVLQHKAYRALPDSIAEHWLGVLEHELSKAPIRRHWLEHGHHYHPALKAEVGQRLPALAKEAEKPPEEASVPAAV
jgi:hypothetical protein